MIELIAEIEKYLDYCKHQKNVEPKDGKGLFYRPSTIPATHGSERLHGEIRTNGVYCTGKHPKNQYCFLKKVALYVTLPSAQQHEGVVCTVSRVASQHTDRYSVWLVLNSETHVWLFCYT